MRKTGLPGKLCFFALAIILAGCGSHEVAVQPTTSTTIAILPANEDAFSEVRLALVKDSIQGAGITNEDVL